MLARARERGVVSIVLAFDARRTPSAGACSRSTSSTRRRRERRRARGRRNRRLLYREPLLEELAEAGWRTEIVFECRANALPTPTGVALQGAVVDGLPVAPTEIDWIVLEAR